MKIKPFTKLLAVFLFFTVAARAATDSPTLRIDADQLNNSLGQKNLIIIDTRQPEDYLLQHIPGAVNFPDQLSYQNKELSGRIVGPDMAQQLLRERGIDNSKTAIVYDDGNMTKSARVLWMLEVYGMTNVKILNGGLAAWLSKKLPVADTVSDITASQYVVQINPNRIASKFSTQLATLNPQQMVIDARPANAYRGESSTAKRFGHIPSAVNIPVHSNFSAGQSTADANFLLPASELQKLYADIPKDQKVIIYCEAGTVSSTNYLVLRELGYNVSNYDASWREWGNDLSLPIEK